MTRRTLLRVVVAVISAVAVWGPGHEAAWATLRLVRVPATFSSPVFVTSARDGSNRLFIVERAGVIKVLQPGSIVPTVFLNITPNVVVGNERGFLGLTFHPEFSVNRRFFVNYSRASDNATVIAEYKASLGDPNVADPAETVILVIPQTDNFHISGMIEFGPDGFLYIGMGDGLHPDRSQDLEVLHGKILRIDVDVPNLPDLYSSPTTNPFFGPTAGRDEIYAYGFRNPWRFSFDRLTGDLYVGDVGQEQVEEIDVITSGGNYGWYIWEGSTCSDLDPPMCVPGSYIFPITEYDHSAGRCSVIGGYVYRGVQTTLPLGSYLFGDLCTGEIFALQGGTVSLALEASSLAITSFGEDEAGEIYVVGFGADSGLHRLVDIPPTTERDFNVDDRSDILWRNASTGSVALWFVNGTTLTGSSVPGGATADWQIAGVGDVNGDGRADLLWRHNSGLLAVWLLDGSTVIGTGLLPSVGADWQILRVADFNGDGKADILWHNSISDTYTMWILDGATVLWTGALAPNSPGAGWQVVGAGDFNNDGKADILWRDPAGTVTVWLMNATKRIDSGTLGVVANSWQVERVADFSGDGKADILWRHDSGTVAIWLLNGTNITAAGMPGSAGPDWQIEGVGDFNGDGRTDILWRHDSGAVYVWLLNGTAFLGSGVVGTAGSDWNIQ